MDPAAARGPMEETLADPDWSMRLRAAKWLVAQDPASDALAKIRPAPVTVPPDTYEAPRLITPAFSPHASTSIPRRAWCRWNSRRSMRR